MKGWTGDWSGHESDQEKGLPAPPIEKPWPPDAVLVDLVDADSLVSGVMPLQEAIGRRRSRRSFTDGALTREELSYLLWSTQGISRIVRGEDGTVRRHYRTVPSGGARHPFETYLLVNRVDGIPPGLYRYLAVEHRLLFLRDVDRPVDEMADICRGQRFVGEGAAVFIWAAVPYRTEWRYSFVAHRDILMEAGHICQNLYLATESIGGGTCAILGYDQEGLDRFIGVDGDEEFAVYLAPVGRIER
ncbi:MAG: SagB/ThcOx family dehydrogenase [Candidatus Krumholzibacteriota bacterium]|nr:SagB/ThcOx family dehydrogenase [Candidatus Krumholzibacteriota bacterium]